MKNVKRKAKIIRMYCRVTVDVMPANRRQRIPRITFARTSPDIALSRATPASHAHSLRLLSNDWKFMFRSFHCLNADFLGE